MKSKIIQITIFSIAMAMLESAVVIYLRALYYPDGFTVAMKLIEEKIILTEIAREVATIVMLIGIALVAGKNKVERFAYFLLSFAIWDIFYYVWLKLFIDWPESLFTWDILFLIPITWLGPVLAPVICSLTMILLSICLITIKEQKPNFNIHKYDWIILITGSVLILFTFIKDYAGIIISNGWIDEIDKLMSNEKFIQITSQFIPQVYNWEIFLLGEFMLIASIILIWIREYNFKTKLYKWS